MQKQAVEAHVLQVHPKAAFGANLGWSSTTGVDMQGHLDASVQAQEQSVSGSIFASKQLQKAHIRLSQRQGQILQNKTSCNGCIFRQLPDVGEFSSLRRLQSLSLAVCTLSLRLWTVC